MPSEQNTRNPQSGFTLLESLLAFAILGIALAGIYAMSIQSFRQQIKAKQQYELAAMARALLDEYIATYPAMPISGTYKSTWTWRISEAPQDVLKPTEFDFYFDFVRITAHVSRGSETEDFDLSTVVARRAEGT